MSWDPDIPLLVSKSVCYCIRYLPSCVESHTVDNSQEMESGDWRKKMWYIYIMKSYSAIKKNEIMVSAGKWIEIKIIISNKISQTLEDKLAM